MSMGRCFTVCVSFALFIIIHPFLICDWRDVSHRRGSLSTSREPICLKCFPFHSVWWRRNSGLSKIRWPGSSEQDHPCGLRGMSFSEARDPSSAQADSDASQAKLSFIVRENHAVNCVDNHKFYSIPTCLLHQNNFPTKK